MLDYKGLTIAQALRKAVRERGDAEALAGPDKRLTWPDIYNEAGRLAQGLAKAGVERGDKVGTIFGTNINWVIVKFAVHMLGAVLVPINVNFRAREIEYLLKQAEVKVLIFTDELSAGNYISLLREIDPDVFAGSAVNSQKLPELKTLVCHSPGGKKHSGCLDLGLIPVPESEYDPAFIEDQVDSGSAEDLCNILFTSGSTAFPKGAMHNHSSLLGIGDNLLCKTLDVKPETRLICYMPFYHVAGCVYFTLGSLTSGAFAYVTDFEPKRVMDVIQDEKINVFGGFDAHFNALAAHPEFKKHDLSSINRVVLATGPAWYGKCRELFPSVKLIAHHYGFTEGTGVSMPPDVSDEEKRKFTNGRPWPGVEVKAVGNIDNSPLPPDAPGELCLRGWTLFKGYYKNEEETSKAFDDEGFFHTGDYGWVDADGFVVYRGRIKMMIKTGGENVSEREVEIFLESIPGVKAVQVIGLPDEKWGEAVTAVIEKESGSDLDAARVVESCKGALASFKIPKRVLFLEAGQWPLLGAGKVDKRKLKEIASEKA